MTFIIKVEHMNLVKQIILRLADENKDFSIFLHFVMKFQPMSKLRENQL